MTLRDMQRAAAHYRGEAARSYIEARIDGRYRAGKVEQIQRRETDEQIREAIRQFCGR